MRGTPGLDWCPGDVDRIIPAHAGNSCSKRGSSSRLTDHPRACGELAESVRHYTPSSGSSPRMRGTLTMSVCDRYGMTDSSPRMRGTRWHTEIVICRPRIIPAHAGNSKAYRLHVEPIPDHPRACGELKPCRAAR